MNGQELCIASHSIARISFAKEPHVEQVSLSSLSDVTLWCKQDWLHIVLTSHFILGTCLSPWHIILPHLHVLAGGQGGSQVPCFSVKSILFHLCCPLLQIYPHLLDKFLPVELLDQRIGTFKILIDTNKFFLLMNSCQHCMSAWFPTPLSICCIFKLYEFNMIKKRLHLICVLNLTYEREDSPHSYWYFLFCVLDV